VEPPSESRRRVRRLALAVAGAAALLAGLAVPPAAAQERDGPEGGRESAGDAPGRGGPAGRGGGLPPAPGFIGEIVRDPATGRLKAIAARREIHLCADRRQDPACDSASLQSALDRIAPGGVLVIHPGDYRKAAFVRRDGTRIRALPGARLLGAAVGGKGALVVQANDVTIEGLACSGIAVPSRNGACVRLEGRNLTLRRVHFFDSEQGVLAGGSPGQILIEDSRFENLGRDGQAHGIYTGGGELIIRRSLFLAAKEEGHEIKSRAARTVVEDSVVASLGGNDSYLIDIPNGGEAVIRRNVLQEGPASVNFTAIAFGMEGIRHAGSRLAIEDNLILMDRPSAIVVDSAGPAASFVRNVVAGPRGGYRFGAVAAACGAAGNVCVAGRGEGLRLARPVLTGIGGLDGILAETGLFR